jgi:hypothetical protein
MLYPSNWWYIQLLVYIPLIQCGLLISWILVVEVCLLKAINVFIVNKDFLYGIDLNDYVFAANNLTLWINSFLQMALYTMLQYIGIMGYTTNKNWLAWNLSVYFIAIPLFPWVFWQCSLSYIQDYISIISSMIVSGS